MAWLDLSERPAPPSSWATWGWEGWPEDHSAWFPATAVALGVCRSCTEPPASVRGSATVTSSRTGRFSYAPADRTDLHRQVRKQAHNSAGRRNRTSIPAGHPGSCDQSTSVQPSSAGWSHVARSMCGYSRRNRSTAASLAAASITHSSLPLPPRHLPERRPQDGTLPGSGIERKRQDQQLTPPTQGVAAYQAGTGFRDNPERGPKANLKPCSTSNGLRTAAALTRWIRCPAPRGSQWTNGSGRDTTGFAYENPSPEVAWVHGIDRHLLDR